ncbi:MAG: hemolysin family protein [Rickettsiales bacterium]
MAEETGAKIIDPQTSADEKASDRPLQKFMDRWLRALFRARSDNSLKEVLAEVIKDHEAEGESELSSEEKDILRNMLAVGEVTVSDVMVPRTDIVAVDIGISLEDLKRVFLEQRHTRMPVYQDNLDHIRGFIHLKDIVAAIAGDEEFSLEKVLRKLMFVAPSMKVVDLLVQMRLSGEHIAIVVDEYGGTDGLVSLEDLFEEIVGDIQDEHDEGAMHPEMIQVGPRIYEMDGRTYIDSVAEKLNKAFISEETREQVDTFGGLVLLLLGRVPARGEVLEIEDLGRVEVLDVDPRRVRKLRLTVNE